MKILNLYAGIGGNRKLWGDVHDITAIELVPKIAEIYRNFFPKDKVIIVDAHQYLLDHFHEFDFIWSSPPCPSHSRIRRANGLNPYKDNTKQLANGGGHKGIYPDMTLWQEIIFLQHHFRGKFCVENVISYYEPFLKPQEIGKHYFWTNFPIAGFKKENRGHGDYTSIKTLQRLKGFDRVKNRLYLRNCIEPELGKHILNCAVNKVNLF